MPVFFQERLAASLGEAGCKDAVALRGQLRRQHVAKAGVAALQPVYRGRRRAAGPEGTWGLPLDLPARTLPWSAMRRRRTVMSTDAPGRSGGAYAVKTVDNTLPILLQVLCGYAHARSRYECCGRLE